MGTQFFLFRLKKKIKLSASMLDMQERVERSKVKKRDGKRYNKHKGWEFN